MNNVFKKSDRIELDSEFCLVPDGFRGLVLTKEEIKIRKKVDKETKKPTGEEEQYIDLKQFYYPKLSQTLNKYLELKSCEAKSIEELRDIVLGVETLIKEKLINDFN